MTTTIKRQSVLPDLIDTLVQRLTDHHADDPAVLVVDGLPTSWELGDFIYVGVSDPESATPTPAANVTQDWPLATATGRDESGTLTLIFYVERGSASMKEARDAAYLLFGSLEDVARGDTRLGITGLIKTNLAGHEYDQGQTENGSLAIITARLDFTARI